jgi:sugar/nucleoside kinase (ribokinase family)
MNNSIIPNSSFTIHHSSFKINLPQEKPFEVVGLGLNAMDYLIAVPRYPAFNSKVSLSRYVLRPGGQVATAMVTLARLGCTTRYIGSVGSDDLGKQQLASLADAGVECSQVKVVEGAASQIAFIIIDERSGERTIIWGRDPRLVMQPHDLNRDAVTSGQILHLDGHDVAAATQAARWAQEENIPVIIDIDNLYPGAEELLPLVNFLVTSSEFPQRVTDTADRREALKKLKERYGNYFVAMTLGAEGALAYHEGEYIYSPGFQVECRDTTGAGDAFHGGFIYGLLKGMNIEDTLRLANAVAALNCRELGARGGLPRLAEVEQLLGRSDLKM